MDSVVTHKMGQLKRELTQEQEKATDRLAKHMQIEQLPSFRKKANEKQYYLQQGGYGEGDRGVDGDDQLPDELRKRPHSSHSIPPHIVRGKEVTIPNFFTAPPRLQFPSPCWPPLAMVISGTEYRGISFRFLSRALATGMTGTSCYPCNFWASLLGFKIVGNIAAIVRKGFLVTVGCAYPS